MIILGIETSCDETGFALYDSDKGLLGNIVHAQIEPLNKYGGVFPEVAARYHIQYLTPLLTQILTKCHLNLNDINYIAYTKGPGLVGSLLTGIGFAKSLSLALNIPAIGINHLEGHVLACFIQEASAVSPNIKTPIFPFLTLLASGGHTMLIQVNSLGNYKILGETLDDAAGEALDKTAKLLGLTPPNGKTLADLAMQSINPKRFYFSRPLINQSSLNFSFSGLKTSALNKVKQLSLIELENYKADLAYAFQESVMETLTIKCQEALKATNLNQLVIAGGVSANLVLRQKLSALATNIDLFPKSKSNPKSNNQDHANDNKIELFFPKLEFCTDNAAMIAIAGLMRAQRQEQDPDYSIEPLARWNIESLK